DVEAQRPLLPVRAGCPPRRAHVARPADARAVLQFAVRLGDLEQDFAWVGAAVDPVRPARQGQVAVPVDHAGHDRGPARVHDLAASGQLPLVAGRPDPADGVLLDEHAHAQPELGGAAVGHRRVAIDHCVLHMFAAPRTRVTAATPIAYISFGLRIPRSLDCRRGGYSVSELGPTACVRSWFRRGFLKEPPMLAALDRARLERFRRLTAAVAAGALPILILTTASVATADVATADAAGATSAAGCRPGSGPHLAGQRITATEVARYQASGGLECADLARANLRHANLSHANLNQATLTGAAMEGANLRSANLIQATMDRVNLTGANLRDAKLGQAELKGASLSKADLRFADLGQATLTRANLASANLTRASLSEAQAQGANFRKANLTDADLTAATLTGAHFKGAKLRGASFTGATGAPADQGGGGPGVSVPTLPGAGPAVAVSEKTLQEYLLGGAAVIFILMSLGSVRRYFYTRTTGSFFGGPGAGYGGYGGFGGPSNYGGGFGPGYGPGSPWGGNDASGYGGAATPTTPFTPTPATPYGPMPTAFAGRWRGAGRPARLALAILGALVVATALWLIGHTVANAILIPAGNAGLRLCESTCGTRFAGHAPVGLVAGVILLAIGGTLRAIGRIRY